MDTHPDTDPHGGPTSSSHSTGIPFRGGPQASAGNDPSSPNGVYAGSLEDLRSELYDVVGDLGLKLEGLSEQLRVASNALPPPTSTPVPPNPRPVPSHTEGCYPDTILERSSQRFHDRVNKVQKACESAKKVEGGEYLGMGDPRSLMVWAQSVKQAPLYQFGDAITRYFFVLHNLSNAVESNVLCAIDLEQGEQAAFNSHVDFERHLDLVWKYLCREYTKSCSGLFDYYQSLRSLQLLEPGHRHFEAHLSKFRSLVRAIQTEKHCPLDDSEISAFWFGSLTVSGQQDILRAPRHEVRTFPLMCERARSFYDAECMSSSLGKHVSIVQSGGSCSAPPVLPPTPAAQAPPSRPSARSTPTRYTNDPTAQRPDDTCSDPAIFCLEFLRKFKCQRCLSHAHGTSLCPEIQVAFLNLRCPQCGVHHDRPVGNPAAHCAGVQCHRCGGNGHLGRACPCPEPSKKRPRTTTDSPKTVDVNVVHTNSASKDCRLQMLDVKISSGDDDTSCPARGLLDSGCEVALVSADEFDRWQRAGLSVSLTSDETTLIPFDGVQRHKVLGRGHIKLILDDSTTIDLIIRVASQLGYPLILPLDILRLAGGAVWVIGDGHTDNGDSILLRPDIRGLLRQAVDPGRDLKQIGLSTYVIDSLDGSLRANSVGTQCPRRDEDFLDDYADVPRHADQLLPVALVPDRSAPDGRPSISIPWRSSDRPKPNFAQAKARDASVLRRLDPQQRRQYEACVHSLIVDNTAVPIDGPSETASYFIPAVPVFRPSSTTPVRICLDARAINHYIEPCSIRGRASGSLWFFLVSWRTCPFYQVCDLRQAFLRVHLSAHDQPHVCSVICSKPVRYVRLPFGLSFSPHGLHSVTTWYNSSWREDVAMNGGTPAQPRPFSVIKPPTSCPQSSVAMSTPTCENPMPVGPIVPLKLDIVIYVDDYCIRGAVFIEVVCQHEYTTWRLRRHGADCTDEKSFNNASPSPAGNYKGVLGYSTDIGMDTVCFRYPDPLPKSTPARVTRRQAVSLINRYYDPLSLFMEGSAPSRFILADINQTTSDWDTLCSVGDTQALYDWLRTVNEQQPVPRFVDLSDNLNVFADASQLAFCVDVRGMGPSYTRLCGRYGLFPPAQRTGHTIVQKELCALHLALQLLSEVDLVLQEHGPRPATYTVYTDSEINLHRLRQGPVKDDKLGRYERRRLRLIRAEVIKLTMSGVPVTIRHISGSCNPSDVCTRRPTTGSVLLPTDPSTIDKGVRLSPDSFAYKAPPEGLDGSHQVNAIQTEDQVFDDFVTIQMLRDAQNSSVRVSAIRQAVLDKKDKYHKINEDGLVVRVTALDIPDDTETPTSVLAQILVPDVSLQTRLAHAAHEFSHRGRRGTLNLLRKSYFWRKMRTTVKQVCDRCQPCQVSKFDHIARCALGSTVPWAGCLGIGRVATVDVTGPYTHSLRDLQGHLPESRPNFGVTVTDLMTGYTRGCTTSTKSSTEVSQALSILFDSSDWVSVLIASDQCFRSAEFRYWCHVNKISLVLLPSHCPSLMGHGERVHKEIHNYMRTVAQQSGVLDDWTTNFHRAIRVVNTCPYTDFEGDGGLCPHDMHFINKARIPETEPLDPTLGDKLYDGLDSAPSIVPSDVYEDICAIRQQRWSQFKSGWLDRREKTRLETLRRPGMPEVNPGDSVYVWQPMTKKLLWRWRGPYIVTAVDHSIVTIDGKNGLEEKVYLGNCRKVETDEAISRYPEDPAEDDHDTELDSVFPSPTDGPTPAVGSHHSAELAPVESGPMTTVPSSTAVIDPTLDSKYRHAHSRKGLDIALVESNDDGHYEVVYGRVLALDGHLVTVQLYVANCGSTVPINLFLEDATNEINGIEDGLS
ncbi:hypothetical protein Pmar_PMAR026277 [Perkinsus marinus ATCC 50983]|uniref:Uncharacterized protein n=1 Tax=Perkinsus marinus (strain ATCC 50983 / TXsc) TaxID=423536 RepID=C5LI65_PERM5|nr:hypothetical protein Pmar_PMAR026277 [Perkinsus marinus ATCC 50983]EER03600.1 hypothetical protein Pmar_PMAR026277 [Perkinsus marinus ATCC 50983]|eukprot:XP_002771784.1 hypothetical protein Pmar_PMAR026277 [Perkinsus marinus ATCC 50983]